MSILQHSLLVLCFFPSITFGVISAEIFPWAILFFIFSIRKIARQDFIFSCALIFFLSLSALTSFLLNPESDAIRSFAAYLNPIVAFIAFLNMPESWVYRSIKLVKKILLALVLLGIAQYVGILRPFEPVIQALIPRASGGTLSEFGGRGVTLLSTEPSRAGVELVFFYFIWRMTQPAKFGTVKIDIAFLAYIAFILKAAQPMAFGFVVIGLLITRRPVHLVPFVLAALIAPLVELNESNNRLLLLATKVFSSGSLSDTMLVLVNAAGPRLISIYAFITSGFSNPIGYGVGNWPVSSILALDATGYDLDQISYFRVLGEGNSIGIRGSGMLTNLMLDIGFVGTLFFIFWIFSITRRFRTNERRTLILMIVLLFKISFIGSIGEPIPWIAAALILRFNKAEWRSRRDLGVLIPA